MYILVSGTSQRKLSFSKYSFPPDLVLNWCSTPYPRIFHLYHAGQHYSDRIRHSAQEKPTAICKLLTDLQTYSWIGSQHELGLNSDHNGGRLLGPWTVLGCWRQPRWCKTRLIFDTWNEKLGLAYENIRTLFKICHDSLPFSRHQSLKAA